MILDTERWSSKVNSRPLYKPLRYGLRTNQDKSDEMIGRLEESTPLNPCWKQLHT
jgi:hypothetical protein